MTTWQHRDTSRARHYALTDGPETVAECRAVTRQALREWFGQAGAAGCTAVEDAVLLVSEVVGNACRHADGPYELSLDHTDRRLRAQVSDASPARPRPSGPHRPARSSGHGLYLLDRLAAAWGCLPRPRGKAVWFEIDIPPEDPGHAPVRTPPGEVP
ncbi:ATP-binding protein [Streptomyces sp. NPDC054861]